MKKIVLMIFILLAFTMFLVSCNKNSNKPIPDFDGEYEGLSTITTIATQAEWTDSILLYIVDNEYEYTGREDLNEGTGYLLLTSDSVRFIDYRATLFEHWDWILRGTYKYSMGDSVLTLFKETATKTYHYELKYLD